MISNNYVFYSIKILKDLAKDIVIFPMWWYSFGLWHLLANLQEFVKNKQKSLALLVWIKNIFKPMYGQYDWQGMLISFFVRAIQIIFRSLIMLSWVILALIVLFTYLFLPFIVFYQIILQIL